MLYQSNHKSSGFLTPTGKHQSASRWLLGLLLFLAAGAAHALTLESVDDNFGVPFGKPLQIEAFGVLENDILDGQSAGENGATAELLSGVSNGTLSCPTDPTLALCADGSFDYSPGSGFSGADSFTYQAVFNGVVSAPATVTLTACTGGPDIFSCWQESSYLGKLTELGYGAFVEGFEGTEWDSVRSTINTTNSAASIISQGIAWTSNHPGTNEITTGGGPARTGEWGGYDPNHGFATGSSGCDADVPPDSCLFHDGLSGKILTGGDALHGAGGYITGTTGANIAIILDGTTKIAIGKLPDSGHHFFGLIDARAAGFNGFEFRELDGKVGDARFIFGDDFMIATSGLLPGNTPPVADAGGPYSGAAGSPVSFDGSGSSDVDGTIVNYDWNFGDGSSGAGISPNHTYATAGLYTVTLTVTDNDGATSIPATTNATIDPVNQAPTADPNGPYNGTVDVALTFDGSGSTDTDGTIAAYNWDFGDGNTGAGISPNHTYTTVGLYTVSLTVTDNDGATSIPATTTATIDPANQAPTADANGPYNGTVDVALSFDGSGSTDPDGTIVAYNWDFGDGNTGAGIAPNHTYTTAGLYTVSLTVMDNDGATSIPATTNATIDPVNQAPTADPNGPYNGTVDVALSFDGSGSTDPDGAIVAYDWDFGDGNTGAGISPNHTYTTEGLYTVSLTVTDDAGASSDPATTTTATIDPVNQAPTADANGPYTGVVDVNVMFDGTGSGDPDGNIVSYDWEFGDGATGTGPQPQHAYATIGTFSVTLRVTDNDGAISGPATATATIDPANQAPTADANGPYNGTVDVPLTFDGSGSTDPDGTIVAYDWDFGDGNTGAGVAPTHTYTTDGVFTVSLTVTDDGGLTGTAATTATIALGNQPPVADPNGPYTGTAASPVSFDGSGSTDPDGAIVAYDWDFGDGTVLPDAGPTPTHTYAAAGLYNVTLTVMDNDGARDSAGATADIGEGNQPPVADPSGPYTGTAGLPVTFDGSGSTDPDGTIVAYDWDFGDGNIGTGVTPTHTYGTDGVFTLTLTVTDDAGATSSATTTASIGPVNQPPLADANGPYTGVVDVNVMFDGTSSGDPDGTIMSYDWDFGDGATGTGSQPQHAYATDGTFTVTLTVTDDDDATSDPATTTATIDPANQAPTADANGPYNGTVDVALSFDGSGSNDPDGTIVAYEWDFGDGNTGTGVTPTHTYATDGVFTVSLTVTDDGGLTDMATTTATIALGNQPPVADPNGPYTGTAASPVTFDGSASTDPDGAIVAYDWDFGDGTVLPDAGPTPTHTYAAAGLYNVTLTVTDNDGVSDSAGTTADIQEANTFSITKAEWRVKSKTLVVNGDGAARHEFVTVTDADSATYVGTAKVIDKGKWKLRVRRIQPVPCRVEAKWRDTLIVADVVNAPADCGLTP